ncbi:MAG: hypothetical protein PHD41_04260 [Methanosarcinaceae archaeon]|nr:hypothetical protein [Methanosarcinaceae archaeon]MDD4331603.1 hypothetical protein [Methanosarcinaceae archaeon]
MAEKLNGKILEILTGKQLSISGINRELKAEGIDEHRLILTGYLRALRDLDILIENDVPPSKIYSRAFPDEENVEVSSSESLGVYSLIKKHLEKLELDLKIPVGVYLISKLFERPCFREELRRVGITSKHLQQYFEKTDLIGEVSAADLKGCRAEISRIKIPPSDPGYEIIKESNKIASSANKLLLELLKEKIDIEGLVPKTKQTKLIISDEK